MIAWGDRFSSTVDITYDLFININQQLCYLFLLAFDAFLFLQKLPSLTTWGCIYFSSVSSFVSVKISPRGQPK